LTTLATIPAISPPRQDVFPVGMKRADFYALSVYYRPTPVDPKYAFLDHPHVFHFAYPPTRADFHVICQALPWTHTFSLPRDDGCPPFAEVLAKHDWPLVAPCFKAADVKLKNDAGVEVGFLSVNRECVWHNSPIDLPWINTRCRAISARCANPRAAQDHLDKRHYYMLEKLMGHNDEDTVIIDRIIRDTLIEGGFLQGKSKKAKAPQVVVVPVA